jgi:hypothetical protein
VRRFEWVLIPRADPVNLRSNRDDWERAPMAAKDRRKPADGSTVRAPATDASESKSAQRSDATACSAVRSVATWIRRTRFRQTNSGAKARPMGARRSRRRNPNWAVKKNRRAAAPSRGFAPQ